jgi:hypothetical protein
MFLLSWQQLSITMEHYQLDIYLKIAILSYQRCLEFYSVSIDIKRKNRLLKVYYVPATSTTFLAFFSFFLAVSINSSNEANKGGDMPG